MITPLDLASAAEAAGRLGISRASLYAYVSRGLIRSFASPKDPRVRLYAVEDVDALVRRRTRLRRPVVAAATALDWGLPVLDTGITRIEDHRLFYRDVDAVHLAETATLEDTARLLVGALDPDPFAEESPSPGPVHGAALGTDRFLGQAIRLLSASGSVQDTSEETGDERPTEVASILRLMASAATGYDPERRPIHEHLALFWSADEAGDALRRALVLCADHELSASAFAVRVAASTGASLRNAMVAGLATLSGIRHGGATDRARLFFNRCLGSDGGAFLDREIGRREPLPGFSHSLYPAGDPRAAALLPHLPLEPGDRRLLAEIEGRTGQRPSIDAGLVLLERTFGLPEGAAFAVFAIGRTVGWLAHAREQRESGLLIRPRARFVLRDAGERGP